MLIAKNASKYAEYVRIEKECLVGNLIDWKLFFVGIFILILAHPSVVHRISNVETDVVKTGFSGTLGNKGAALVRFKVDDS